MENRLRRLELRSLNNRRKGTFCFQPSLARIANFPFFQLERGSVPDAVAKVDFVPEDLFHSSVRPRPWKAAANASSIERVRDLALCLLLFYEG